MYFRHNICSTVSCRPIPQPNEPINPYQMNTNVPAKPSLHLTRSRLDSLATRREIDRETLSKLSHAQKKKLKADLQRRTKHATFAEKPGLLEKIALLNGDEPLRREIWEDNHRTVVTHMAAYFDFHGSLPSTSTLAMKTGLSRQCVIRHLTTYREEPEYEIQKAKMKIMKGRLMEKVLHQAFMGDVQAAKVYIDAVTKMEDKEKDKAEISSHIRQQNNFFQVNGIVISKEKLEQLPPDQLKMLEQIFSEK